MGLEKSLDEDIQEALQGHDLARIFLKYQSIDLDEMRYSAKNINNSKIQIHQIIYNKLSNVVNRAGNYRNLIINYLTKSKQSA